MFFIKIYLSLLILTAHVLSKGQAPRPWIQLSSQTSHPDEPITLYLVVKQDQTAVQKLESIFWNITDPDNNEYQNWLTRSEINAILQPDNKALTSVGRWIQKQSFTSTKLIGNDTFQITTTVGQASNCFSIQFQPYTNSKTGQTIHRTLENVLLADEISPHVYLLLGLNDFLSINKKPPKSSKTYTFVTAAKSTSDTPTNVDPIVIPQFVIQYYNIPNVLKTGLSSAVSQGSLQFLGQYYSEQDLRQYLQSLDIPYKPLQTNHILGIDNQSNPGGETMLDVEQMSGINPLAENWYFNYNTKNMSGENFYTTVLTLNQLDDLPQVLSISYGDPETGLCTFVSDCDENTLNTAQKYINRTNIEFMKLTMRGITVLVSSGDDGANGHNTNCTNEVFYPVYPASSPFVTSVGATEIVNRKYETLQDQPPACFNITVPFRCMSGGQEVAVDVKEALFTSGSGFSNFVSQPSYQKDAVNHYFQDKPYYHTGFSKNYPPPSMYNRYGRAYPDVAALGADGFAVFNNEYYTIGGTSMSSPLWAGIVSILNSYSINITGQTLGFLNPLFYKMAKECPGCFKDIILGDNKCTENTCTNQCKGFEAAYGWDPVTGLGTPNVGKMLHYITNLLENKINKTNNK